LADLLAFLWVEPMAVWLSAPKIISVLPKLNIALVLTLLRQASFDR
jgi:hypothetical protein